MDANRRPAMSAGDGKTKRFSSQKTCFLGGQNRVFGMVLGFLGKLDRFLKINWPRKRHGQTGVNWRILKTKN